MCVQWGSLPSLGGPPRLGKKTPGGSVVPYERPSSASTQDENEDQDEELSEASSSNFILEVSFSGGKKDSALGGGE